MGLRFSVWRQPQASQGCSAFLGGQMSRLQMQTERDSCCLMGPTIRAEASSLQALSPQSCPPLGSPDLCILHMPLSQGLISAFSETVTVFSLRGIWG